VFPVVTTAFLVVVLRVLFVIMVITYPVAIVILAAKIVQYVRVLLPVLYVALVI
jgi:hypothetical protein